MTGEEGTPTMPSVLPGHSDLHAGVGLPRLPCFLLPAQPLPCGRLPAGWIAPEAFSMGHQDLGKMGEGELGGGHLEAILTFGRKQDFAAF